MFFLVLMFLIGGTLHGQEIFNLKVNPSGMTPLSLLLEMNGVNTQSLTITVQGKTPNGSIGVVYPAGTGRSFPVHGLYMGHTNKILVKYGNEPQREFTVITTNMNFTTKPLPTIDGPRTDRPFTITPKVITPISAPNDPFNQDLYFVSFNNAYYIMGFDNLGDIRYIYYNQKEHPLLMRMEQTSNNILMTYIDNGTTYITRDLMANLITINTNRGHHGSAKYKDGREIMLGISPSPKT